MGLDLFDILAVILGVLFTIRKLDAQRRAHKEFPHVDPTAFSDWQKREVAAYSLGMFACFSKVLAKLLVVYVLHERMSYQALRFAGMAIDLSWLALAVLTLVRGHYLAKERARLGIVLGGLVVPAQGSELTTEMKEALLEMEDGNLEKASYQLHQVSLEAEEDQKALALYWLGECLLRQGKPQEAKDAFLESLEVDPRLVEPREALGRLENVDAR